MCIATRSAPGEPLDGSNCGHRTLAVSKASSTDPTPRWSIPAARLLPRGSAGARVARTRLPPGKGPRDWVGIVSDERNVVGLHDVGPRFHQGRVGVALHRRTRSLPFLRSTRGRRRRGDLLTSLHPIVCSCWQLPPRLSERCDEIAPCWLPGSTESRGICQRHHTTCPPIEVRRLRMSHATSRARHYKRRQTC